MATDHFNFPTIVGTDPIDGVNAINGLANAVDTAMYSLSADVIEQSSDISNIGQTANNAASNANAATTNATAAQQAAAAAQQTASAANNTAAAAQRTANSAIMAVNDLASKFSMSTSTITSGLSLSNFRYSLSFAHNEDGTLFKFYGWMQKNTGSSSSITRVSIPGGRGDYAYGIATGFILPTHPNEAYVIAPAGLDFTLTSSPDVIDVLSFDTYTSICVGTDGQIYIFPSNVSSQTIAATYGNKIGYIPSLYINADFGDIVINPDGE